MSGDDVTASFVLDYELSADDLREWVASDRSARRRRTSSAVGMTVTFILACSGTVVGLVLRHKLLSCVSAQPTPRYLVPQVWLWECNAGPPSALLGNDTELVAAVAVLWCLCVSYAMNLWRGSPTRQARKMIAAPGAAGHYGGEISAAGVTSVSPEGVATHLPWSAFSAVRETDQTFFLLGTDGQERVLLPKRGLSEPESVQRLSDFLRESTHST